MPGKNTFQVFSGEFCSMRRALSCMDTILFRNDKFFFYHQGTRCSLRNELNIEFSGRFYFVCNFEWSYQLITNDCLPKHHSTTSLLTPVPVRTWTPPMSLILAMPSFPPPIGSIKGGSTLIDEQNSLEIYLHVIFCLLHSLSCGYPLMQGDPLPFHIL